MFSSPQATVSFDYECYRLHCKKQKKIYDACVLHRDTACLVSSPAARLYPDVRKSTRNYPNSQNSTIHFYFQTTWFHCHYLDLVKLALDHLLKYKVAGLRHFQFT